MQLSNTRTSAVVKHAGGLRGAFSGPLIDRLTRLADFALEMNFDQVRTSTVKSAVMEYLKTGNCHEAINFAKWYCSKPELTEIAITIAKYKISALKLNQMPNQEESIRKVITDLVKIMGLTKEQEEEIRKAIL
ncbi:MAG: hypothetical protein AABX38_04955 [Candidatus Micrarchaeota archaeon]